MVDAILQSEPTVRRQVFAHWSIEMPRGFRETHVAEDSYWHAWDDTRSISLSSIIITDRRGRAVPAGDLVAQLAKLEGEPLSDLPAGLIGQAITAPTDQPARASMAVSGLLATDGRVLLATITSDDLEWAKRIWLSIRAQP